MTGTIGIKEANGNFFPIVEANSEEKKRLVLVTAHDHQKSTQIDLYKSIAKSMVDAFYIGSIVLENTSSKANGQTSIELIVSSSPDGSVSVDAVEVGNPSNEHHLSISLNSLEEDKTDYGDFDADEDATSKKTQIKGQKRKIPWFVIIIIGVVLALICLALWYFLIENPPDMSWPESRPSVKAAAPQTDAAGTPAVALTEAVTGVVLTEAVTDVVLTEAAAIQPVVIERPPQTAEQTAASQPGNRGRTANRINAPQTIPSEGITYKVRWGDTLWDISEAFYRNPRLYPVIVRSNDIPNPNRIVSGTELTIPPKN